MNKNARFQVRTQSSPWTDLAPLREKEADRRKSDAILKCSIDKPDIFRKARRAWYSLEMSVYVPNASSALPRKLLRLVVAVTITR